MPPDPTGSRPALTTLGDSGRDSTQEIVDGTDWYDRSSLPGDFMVMIAGQTEEDWFRRAPDTFCELIDGIVYMPPRVSAEHQEDVNFLLFLIQYYHLHRPVCYIATGPVAIKLREGCLLEPDLFLVPEAAREQVREETFGRPPVLLVVEVLSPSNRVHDLDTKAKLYREAKVDEIWFVDRLKQVVLVERREGEAYVTERIGSGPVVSRSLPGFWFDAGWLWAEPDMLECANRILAGPPGR